MSGYDEIYRSSIDNPAEFWAQAAEALTWDRVPGRILDDSAAPLYRWFPDGELNTSVNALDRHVAEGRADADGYWRDEFGNRVDHEGNRVDEDGNRVDAGGDRIDPADEVIGIIPPVPPR